jgi:hypothetical protein
MRRCHVHSWPPEYADEHLGSARGLAVNALVPSGDPVLPAARQHDAHGRHCRATRRLVGGSRNVMRRYIEWTYLNGKPPVLCSKRGVKVKLQQRPFEGLRSISSRQRTPLSRTTSGDVQSLRGRACITLRMSPARARWSFGPVNAWPSSAAGGGPRASSLGM